MQKLLSCGNNYCVVGKNFCLVEITIGARQVLGYCPVLSESLLSGCRPKSSEKEKRQGYAPSFSLREEAS